MPSAVPAPSPTTPAASAVGGAARLLWGIVAVCAVFGMCGSFVQTLGDALSSAQGPGPAVVVVRYFSYFTILTNLFVAMVSVPLSRGRRPGPLLRVLTLNAVTGIVITGVVHWFLLRPISDIAPGVPTLLDDVQHVLVPVITPIVWLVIGPHGHVRARTFAASLVFPLIYLVWTLVHGAATGWYPYPFIDIPTVGYRSALSVGGLILVIMCALAALCWAWDRWRARRLGS
jgi:hypothetical protein